MGKLGRYDYACPVPREVFEECARAAAPYLFAYDNEAWNICQEKGLIVDYILKPEDAPKYTKMSPPTFRKKAKQFLVPEKYGKLPDCFFGEAPKLKPEKADELMVFDYGK